MISMKKFAMVAVVGAMALGASGCALGDGFWRQSSDQQFACYWMSVDGSRWEKQSAATTKERCFQLDSCSGGEGESGGGCYKWAASPLAPGMSW